MSLPSPFFDTVQQQSAVVLLVSVLISLTYKALRKRLEVSQERQRHI
jgi:hypothetical protein